LKLFKFGYDVNSSESWGRLGFVHGVFTSWYVSFCCQLSEFTLAMRT